MASLVFPEDDPLVAEIVALASKACLEARCTVTNFTDGVDFWTGIVVTFRPVPGCPKEGDERPFSPALRKLLLAIGKIEGTDIDVATTPAADALPSGGNLGRRTIHIDGRRKDDKAFGPGSFIWQLIHELAHFFFGPFPGSDEEDRAEFDDVAEQDIHLTNIVRRQLGLECYRYPDHGLEVFICPGPPGKLKAVEVDADGTVKQEAAIDVGVDPNPIVPFTGGQRLAGPGTF